MYKTLTQNILQKLAAIVLASVIWGYFHFSLTEKQAYYEIDVLVKPNKNQIISSVEKNTVAIVLKGSREQLNNISNKDFVVEKVLPAKISPGRQSFSISSKDVTLVKRYSDISVDSVAGKVWLYADNIVSKTVEILPQYESFLDKNYDIKAKVKNPQIKIFGPSLILKNLSILKTEPVTIESYNKTSFDTPANIKKIKNVTPEYEKVTVSFQINEKQQLFNLINVPINIIYLGKQNSIVTSAVPRAEITLTIPPNVSKNLHPQNDFKLFVEIPQSPSKTATYKVKFMTSVYKVRVKDISPQKIQLSTKEL